VTYSHRVKTATRSWDFNAYHLTVVEFYLDGELVKTMPVRKTHRDRSKY